MAHQYYKSLERAERARSRRLARELKEFEKASAQDAAKTAVASYEARISELKSLHKQSTNPVDWVGLASILSPAPPALLHSEVDARKRSDAVLRPLGEPPADLEAAAALDQVANEAALREHQEAVRAHGEDSEMAFRILSQDLAAYFEILKDNPALLELTERGGRLTFSVPTPEMVACSFAPQSSSVVPAEIQSLTATGRLATKAMTRSQLFDLYQDFICSGILRIAREVLAMLPVRAVLITAYSGDDAASEAIISTIIRRTDLEGVDFQRCDPSDTIETFHCRTKFKATRKAGAFQAILPFTLEDVVAASGAARASGPSQEVAAPHDTDEMKGGSTWK